MDVNFAKVHQPYDDLFKINCNKSNFYKFYAVNKI